VKVLAEIISPANKCSCLLVMENLKPFDDKIAVLLPPLSFFGSYILRGMRNKE
jgi:hypothetical protein